MTLLFIIAPTYAKTIVILGDSLSAAYGMPASQGWVELLKKKLRKTGHAIDVLNLSTSGDTSINSLSKLRAHYKKSSIELVVIQIGSNDALRGLSLAQLNKNILAMIHLAKKNHSLILLITNRLPPNYGNKFTLLYQNLFKKIATNESIPLVQKLLAGVADKPALMQADGLHPKENAQPKVLDNVWLLLKPVLNKI